MELNCCLAHLSVSVCVSVGLESGEQGRSRDGLLDVDGDRRRKACFIWGDLGHPL